MAFLNCLNVCELNSYLYFETVNKYLDSCYLILAKMMEKIQQESKYVEERNCYRMLCKVKMLRISA